MFSVCFKDEQEGKRGDLARATGTVRTRAQRHEKNKGGRGVRENELREQHTQLLIVGIEDCKQTVIGGEWER